jgi:hypothetical protein
MIKIIELDEDNLTRGAKGLENESKLLNAEFHAPNIIVDKQQLQSSF